jgi:hypothetical protein
MAKIFPASVIENWQLGARGSALDPPLPTTVGFIAAIQARDERSCMAARDVLAGMASVAAR